MAPPMKSSPFFRVKPVVDKSSATWNIWLMVGDCEHVLTRLEANDLMTALFDALKTTSGGQPLEMGIAAERRLKPRPFPERYALLSGEVMELGQLPEGVREQAAQVELVEVVYRVAQDVVERVGIGQGKLGKPRKSTRKPKERP